MGFQHKTVLLDEAIAGLKIKQNGLYIDCTLGGGGHAEAILSSLSEDGHLFAFDQDEMAINHAEQKFANYTDRLTIINNNFINLQSELENRHIKKVDGILYDLGVSSPQLDIPERGFSYHHDAPLDMRMDQTSKKTAATIVNEWPYEQLVSIFFKYGEERFSKQIARKIESFRKQEQIETTGQLVEIIKDAIPAPARRRGGHPAKRTFQAIRIAVNDELAKFEQSLEQALQLIRSGGRICVITFHSLEDRICKAAFKEASEGPYVPPGMPIVPDEYKPDFKLITRRPIVPTDAEIEKNNRARSAKLRIIEKL